MQQCAASSEHKFESFLVEVVDQAGKQLSQSGERPDLVTELDTPTDEHMTALRKHADQLSDRSALANTGLATDQHDPSIAAHDRLANLL